MFIYCLFKSFVSQSNFFTGKLESLLFNSQARDFIELAMRELTSLEKKEETKLAKKLKNKTHFNLKDILRLMEHHRQHCAILDEMEKTEFINLINNNFKFDDKILLERIFQVFNISRVSMMEYTIKYIFKQLYLGWLDIKGGVRPRDERLHIWKPEGANQVLFFCVRSHGERNHCQGRSRHVASEMSATPGTRRGWGGWS